ncbi:MAG: hypothetical protein R3D26_22970 [Cyanobacteriota/Melainabacteria group bacterium]
MFIRLLIAGFLLGSVLIISAPSIFAATSDDAGRDSSTGVVSGGNVKRKLRLVKEAVLSSERYKEYSQSQRRNIGLLLNGLDPMAVRNFEVDETVHRLMSAFESYSMVLTTVKNGGPHMPKADTRLHYNFLYGPPYRFPGQSGPNNREYLNGKSVKFKQEFISSLSGYDLHYLFQYASKELNYYCAESYVIALDAEIFHLSQDMKGRSEASARTRAVENELRKYARELFVIDDDFYD